MFSRISQLGKNFTDELENVVNPTRQGSNGPSGPNGSNARPPPNPIKVLKANSALLSASTPDPDSMRVDEEAASGEEVASGETEGGSGQDGSDGGSATEEKSRSIEAHEDSSQEPNEQQSTTSVEASASPVKKAEASNTSIDGRKSTPVPKEEAAAAVPTDAGGVTDLNLPKEMRLKLRKFDKYEEKYPLLLDAYRTERKRGLLIKQFERLLAENTPCTSISEAGVLVEYLKGLVEKNDLQTRELRKLADQNGRLIKEKDEYASQLESLERQNKVRVAEITTEKDAEIDRLNGLNEELTKKLENTASSEDLNEALKERDDLKTSLKDLEETLREKEHTVVELEKSTEELNGKIAAQTKDADAAKSEIEEKNTAVEEYKKRLEDVSSKIKELEVEVAAAGETNGEQHKEITSELSSKAPEPAFQQPSGKGKNKKKKGKGKGPSVSNVSTTSNASSTPAVTVAPKETGTTSTEPSTATIEEISLLKEQIKKKDEQIAALNDMVKSMGLDLVDAREKASNSNEELKTKYELLLKECDDLKAQVQKLEEHNAQLNADNDNIKDENQKVLEKLKTTSGDYEGKLAELEKHLAAADASAKDRFKELTQTKSTFSGMQQELKELRSKNEQLTKEANVSSELSKSERSLKEEVSRLTAAITAKDTSISRFKSQLEASQATKVKDDAKLNTFRQTITKLETDLKQLQAQHEKVTRELKTQTSSKAAWSTERSKLIADVASLKSSLHSLESEKTAAVSVAETMRSQTEELSMRMIEAKSRVEALEEELEEARNHLQERMRESTTMRRLVDEANNSQAVRLREATETIKYLTEERDRLDSELTYLTKRRHRENESFRAKQAEVEQQLAYLEDEKNRFKEQLSDFQSSAQQNSKQTNIDNSELEETRQAIVKLKEALDFAERSLQEQEKANSSLKKLVEENQQRAEKLQKNQRTLSEDIRVLQAEKSHLESRVSKYEGEQESKTPTTAISSPGASPNVSRRASRTASISQLTALQGSATGAQQPNIAYIKNVLLGFLEHKEQRQQLLPVVSTLLNFKDNDERRFWTAVQT